MRTTTILPEPVDLARPQTWSAAPGEPPPGEPGRERFELRRVPSREAREAFAEDVARGLVLPCKSLPPKYFYDELGSFLFEAICCLPEYYPTRAEREILEREAGAIAAAVSGDGRPVRVMELGSGSARKTRLLLAALLERQPRLDFLPIDISRSALEQGAQELLQLLPGLSIIACEAGFEAGLDALAPELADASARTVAVFLGSTIGNFEPDEAAALLARVRAALRPGDLLLLGTDLKKSEAVLLPAYDDALGVTAAFNLNLLTRINRELGGGFEPRRFAHRAVYDRERGRIEMHLVSREEQTVPIAALGLEVPFAAGETIHTESSYKFDREQVAALARATGFTLERHWEDGEQRFRLNLLAVAPAGGETAP